MRDVVSTKDDLLISSSTA